MPSDIRYDPPGGGNDSSEPTNDGLAEIPGPAAPATIWKSLTNEQPESVFGDLGDGGMQPITGPIYRWNGKPAGTGGRFPAYWDGAWLIHNRGADNGFWKEVRLRKDNNKMLRVQNFLPANNFGAPNQGLVIGTEFGPDGALYMTKFPVACCRIALDSGDGEPLVRIKFNVQDKCDEDTQAPSVSHELAGAEVPNQAGHYYNKVKLTLTAADNGCAGIDTTEYRVDSGEWKTYADPGRHHDAGRAHDRVPHHRPVRQRVGGRQRVLHDRRDQRRRGTADHAPDQRCRAAAALHGAGDATARRGRSRGRRRVLGRQDHRVRDQRRHAGEAHPR